MGSTKDAELKTRRKAMKRLAYAINAIKMDLAVTTNIVSATSGLSEETKLISFVRPSITNVDRSIRLLAKSMARRRRNQTSTGPNEVEFNENELIATFGSQLVRRYDYRLAEFKASGAKGKLLSRTKWLERMHKVAGYSASVGDYSQASVDASQTLVTALTDLQTALKRNPVDETEVSKAVAAAHDGFQGVRLVSQASQGLTRRIFAGDQSVTGDKALSAWIRAVSCARLIPQAAQSFSSVLLSPQ